VLEVFVISKAWYFAQVIPLPAATASTFQSLMGDFVWAHSMARIAFPQLHRPFSEGGLGLSCPATRAKSLLAKQTFHHLAAGGRPALHLTYWMGAALQDRLPLPHDGPFLTGQPPVQYLDLQNLLLETADLPSVLPAFLAASRSSLIYKNWMADPPRPRVEQKLPALPWDLIWKRLATPSIPLLSADLHFRVLHDILMTRERRHRFRDAPSPACLRCPAPVEDGLQFFHLMPESGWSVGLLAP